MKDDNSSEDLDNTSWMDVGLNFGGSFTIKNNMIIDLRYSMGLANIEDSGYNPNNVYLNGCFSLSFSYLFVN